MSRPCHRTCKRYACLKPFLVFHVRSNQVYCSGKCRDAMRHHKPQEPPPIVHHLRPLRPTWPIGAVPYGTLV